jgi:hypothetical protein
MRHRDQLHFQKSAFATSSKRVKKPPIKDATGVHPAQWLG